MGHIGSKFAPHGLELLALLLQLFLLLLQRLGRAVRQLSGQHEHEDQRHDRSHQESDQALKNQGIHRGDGHGETAHIPIGELFRLIEEHLAGGVRLALRLAPAGLECGLELGPVRMVLRNLPIGVGEHLALRGDDGQPFVRRGGVELLRPSLSVRIIVLGVHQVQQLYQSLPGGRDLPVPVDPDPKGAGKRDPQGGNE